MEKLCLYWRFIESQGSRVLDSSPSNSIGVLVNGAHIDPEPLNSGEPISDEDDWGEKAPLGHALHGICECRNVLNLINPLSMTIELHVKRTGVVQHGNSGCIASVNDVLRLEFDVHGMINLSVGNVTQSSEKKFPLNVWTHFAMILENGGLSLLIDGSLVINRLEFDPNSFSAPVLLRVGSPQTQTTEVRVWSFARSAADIRSTMYSPLSLGGAASKWKGFKIKATSSALEESKSVSIPFPTVEKRIRPRQIESSSPSESVQTKSVQVSVVVPEEPQATNQTDVTVQVQQSTHVPNNSSSRMNTPATINQSHLPSLKMTIADALEYFDERLELALKSFRTGQGMDAHRQAFMGIASEFSLFLQSKFRIGPFFAPRPSHEILSRLRVACQYAALSTILSHKQPLYPRIINCLRIPLMDVDLENIIKIVIDKAWENGDHPTAISLLDRFVSVFPTKQEEITHLRQLVATELGSPRGFARSNIRCPACDRQLKDSLEVVCECRAELCVCYASGALVDLRDCVVCSVCESKYTLPRFTGKLSGNIPRARAQTLPDICKFCLCKGSVSYSDK